MSDPLTHLTTALAERYQIERELGHGGMATVYLARDLKHHRAVAIKVLRPELAHVLGPERFLREIEIAARLQHPLILPVFDSGAEASQDNSAGQVLWYAMPFIAGESLRDRINSERQLSRRRSRADRRRSGPGAGLRSWARRNPSGHQAGEHDFLGWARYHRRLRHCPRARCHIQHPADRDRPRARHPGVHEPGAGGGRGRYRRPLGYLCPGLRALRDARGPATVHRVHRAVGPGPPRGRSGAEPAQRAFNGDAGAGASNPAGAGQGAGRPLCRCRRLRRGAQQRPCIPECRPPCAGTARGAVVAAATGLMLLAIIRSSGSALRGRLAQGASSPWRSCRSATLPGTRPRCILPRA